MAAPAPSSNLVALQPQSSKDGPAESALATQSEQKRRGAKGLNRVETLTSMGVSKPQYPMFPLEDNKKAMIQFEMNLLARVNK